MKTAIVTGATGFIGGALTKKLLGEGVRVYAVGRDRQKLERLCAGGGAIPVQAEFGQYATLDQLIGTKADVDVFYHCAFAGGFGGQAVRDYVLQLDNAKQSCAAVEGALRMGAKRFVLASTVNTVEIRSFMEREDFFPRYTCVYSTGKLAAELMGKALARNGGMEYSAARIAMPYGEGNPAGTLPNVVMKQLCAGVRPKLIEGSNLYDLVYIDDVSGACMRSERRGPPTGTITSATSGWTHSGAGSCACGTCWRRVWSWYSGNTLTRRRWITV